MASPVTDTKRAATQFDLVGYGDLIVKLQHLGYSTCHFDDCTEPRSGDLFLRHDVDYCLSTAARMSEVELALGVASTWFILVRSPLFNPFGTGERDLLRSLRNGGGRVGLHFDASYYSDHLSDSAALEFAAAEEIAALEIASGGPVVAVSFHKPPLVLQHREARFAGRAHTSEPRFMRDILYCSDTLARFSFGEPIQHARQSGCSAMQLLTHPIWWSGAAQMTGVDKLDALAVRRSKAAADAIERSVTAYNSAQSNVVDKGSSE